MAQLYGSINLSRVPRELFKKVTLKDGTTAIFLNIRIGERKTPLQQETKDGKVRVIDHYVSCAPRKEDQKEGVNYFFGDLTEWKQQSNVVTTDDVASAPVANDIDDLPFSYGGMVTAFPRTFKNRHYGVQEMFCLRYRKTA